MSYSIPQNTTPIEMLPELEELETPKLYHNTTATGGSYYATNKAYGSAMIPSEQKEKIERYIRRPHSTPVQSGMIVHHINQAPQQMRTNQLADDMYNEKILNYNNSNDQLGVPNQESGLKTYTMPDNSPTCLSVAEHIANCPICSKFYDNDKTIYIIAIIVLAIVCILLLKRVLNV